MPYSFEDSTNKLNRWLQQNPTNGYRTTMPPYNSYSAQFNPYRRVDYTQPIQNATPPINQALNENFQPQYVQTTDYNGQPVRVPTNAASQFSEYLPNPADVLQWGGQQLVQNLALKNLTGNSLGSWGQKAVNWAVPRAVGAMAAWNVPQINATIDAGRRVLSTPAAQKFGNDIKNIVDWIW